MARLFGYLRTILRRFVANRPDRRDQPTREILSVLEGGLCASYTLSKKVAYSKIILKMGTQDGRNARKYHEHGWLINLV